MLFLFENCVVDTDRRELRRDREIVPLEPQVFDLLVFLVRNRERVVSKDDLFAAVWGRRIVSESALSTRINAVRTAIGDSGDAQRLLRTLPRKGFRFVGEVREESAVPTEEKADKPPDAATPAAAADHASPRSAPVSHRRWILPVAIAIAAAAVATLVIVPLTQRTSVATRGERFDPARVPMLDAADRTAVANYSQQADYKALAIRSTFWAPGGPAPDIETARREALQKCDLRRDQQRDAPCTIYAVGMDVVWPKGMVPVAPPEDQRSEPLAAEFTLELLPRFTDSWRRTGEVYLKQSNHRALAGSAKGAHRIANKSSREEAARLAIERCGYEGQLRCLLLSVDGFWTTEIPAAHRAINVFFPALAAELPNDARERVGAIYRGQPWRALARGRQGTWHAVAGAPSEAAAAENALQACGKVDTECKLFAIGNFRLAQD